MRQKSVLQDRKVKPVTPHVRSLLKTPLQHGENAFLKLQNLYSVLLHVSEIF